MLAPVIGAPDAITRQISDQIVQSGERNRITLVRDSLTKADFTLRGYIVASKERTQTKVSYIWDLSDPTGKRVNRITGEEAAPAATSKDPWTAVTAALTQTIADKSMASLAAWLPSHLPTPAAPAVGAPIASAPVAPGASPQVAARPLEPQSVAPTTPVARVSTAAPLAQPVSTNTTTASLGQPAEVAAIVPAVAGAPGDGNTALSSALQRELSRSGVTLANRPGASYRIEGRVALAPAQGGKQTIKIEWNVRDPQGRSLGTVSQNNEIPQGSLDGTWGTTADAAAGAAAQGILKLLPAPRALN